MNLPEAINHLDIAFGDGYAIEHPEQVIEYIKSQALGAIQYQIEAGTIELKKSIEELSKNVGELTQKLPHID